jgi:hypothetical protein
MQAKIGVVGLRGAGREEYETKNGTLNQHRQKTPVSGHASISIVERLFLEELDIY